MSKNTETVINKLNVLADKFLKEFEEIGNILTWNEHCEHCRPGTEMAGEYILFQTEYGAEEGYIQFEDDGFVLDSTYKKYPLEFNYCPYCGRKLRK